MKRGLLIFIMMLMTTTVALGQGDDTPPDCGPHPTIFANVCSDIAYGADDEDLQRLDLYLPRMGEEAEVVVLMLPGGDFTSVEKAAEVYVELAELFAVHNYAAVSAQYRLLPDAQFPAQVEDAFCALAWVYANGDAYGYSPDHVIVLGHSAGGLLSNLIGTVDDASEYIGTCGFDLPDDYQVDGVISYFAPSGVSAITFGDAFEQSDDALERYSPLYQISENDAPFLLLHGEADEVVPFSESEKLREALDTQQVPVELFSVVDGGHDLQEWAPGDYREMLGAVLRFVDRLVNGVRANI